MSTTLEKLRFDENNVPVLKPFEIEERAEYMLSLFCKDVLDTPKATDVLGIVNKLKQKHDVKFVFAEDLGETADGRRIRGRIAPRERTIWIDRSLDDQLFRLRFTIAHEIGHLALHRLRPIKNYDRIDDTDDDLRMEFDHAGGSRQIAEWQANRYAASTLMPRYTVAMAILLLHNKKEIKRNVGRVYVDDSHGNKELYRETLTYLVSTTCQEPLRELDLKSLACLSICEKAM